MYHLGRDHALLARGQAQYTYKRTPANSQAWNTDEKLIALLHKLLDFEAAA